MSIVVPPGFGIGLCLLAGEFFEVVAFVDGGAGLCFEVFLGLFFLWWGGERWLVSVLSGGCGQAYEGRPGRGEGMVHGGETYPLF